MRMAAAAVTVLATTLVACGAQDGADAGGAPSSSSSPPSTTASPTAPPPARPVRTADCPYLGEDAVAQLNGQHVGRTRISGDEPYPACFFYRPDGELQLMVRVYRGSVGAARALVDRAAPVRTSAKAERPAGWSGGSQPTDDGAVYAVSKGGAAVLVTTNQGQTIKARRATERAIVALGL